LRRRSGFRAGGGMEVAMFDFIPLLIHNVFSKPATRNYPAVRRAPYKGQKGHIAMQISSCIFCGICSRKCPTHAIEVKRPEKSWTIDRFRCIQCNACAESCPKKCLTMEPEYTSPAPRKSRETYQAPAPAAAPEKTAAEAKPGAVRQETSARQGAAGHA
jgi:formate hydrogenlyase subunit 6/NADH:ubiquinone oxidoreductase subunit I